MENFITGYPGCEFQIRAALADVVGQEKSEFFFDKVSGRAVIRPSIFGRADRGGGAVVLVQFLEHFFGEPDAAFFASLGLNCIRIAISYRHFEGQRALPSPSHNSQLATSPSTDAARTPQMT